MFTLLHSAVGIKLELEFSVFPAQEVPEQGFDTLYCNCSAPKSAHAGRFSGSPFLEWISHVAVCMITH